MAKTLVIGSTGMLGMEVVRALRTAAAPVRALTRPVSDPAKAAALRDLGTEIVSGSLHETRNLETACAGARVVVSTASAILSRQPGDSVETVDLNGQLRLIEAAESAEVEHFIYVSSVANDVNCPLTNAKRAIEARLSQSALSFTIVRAACSMEFWLGPRLGFAPWLGQARIFGSGEAKVSWVSLRDVADVIAETALGRVPRSRELVVSGPEAHSQLEILALCEQSGAPRVTPEFVPEAALSHTLMNGLSDLERSFAGIMLLVARSRPISGGLKGTTSVPEYLRRVLGSP